MTLRELQYLVELARLKNFRRAAEVCNVAQPTLSTQIRKLEDELGVILVERGTRKVVLTAAGEEILARAQILLREADDIRAIADRHAAPEAGRLRLGAFPTLGPYLLPLLVPRIASAFPAVELQLVEDKSAALLDHLRQGRIDAAFLALPVAEQGLEIAPVFDEAFTLAVPQDHALAGHGRIGAEAMAGQRLMLLDDGHCLRDQALRLSAGWRAEETPGFRATSLETLRQMVAAGQGITLMPWLASRGALGSQGLRYLPIDGGPGRRIALVWRQSSALTPLLRKLAALSAEIAGSACAG